MYLQIKSYRRDIAGNAHKAEPHIVCCEKPEPSEGQAIELPCGWERDYLVHGVRDPQGKIWHCSGTKLVDSNHLESDGARGRSMTLGEIEAVAHASH